MKINLKGGVIMGECCCMCAKCWSAKLIVIGAIVLATAIYWPGYIWHVLGAILILKGILKLAKPCCPHCETPAAKKAKK